jgi:SAM-dependent methyltransferase
LAHRGLDVTLLDISDVALERAAAAAREAGVALRTQRVDVGCEPLPPGPYALVLCLNFLWRPLFAAIPQVLAPGGLLVFSQPTRANLQRHSHPSARFLLEDGELPELVRGLELVSYTEGWTEEGRHEARLVASRPR